VAEDRTAKEELLAKTQHELFQLRKEYQRALHEHTEQLQKMRMKYEEQLLQLTSQVTRITNISQQETR
jgi:arginyl-tRNA--protein-N-Asp/Glu arginylyltransferase